VQLTRTYIVSHGPASHLYLPHIDEITPAGEQQPFVDALLASADVDCLYMLGTVTIDQHSYVSELMSPVKRGAPAFPRIPCDR
jgi:hypothetical protein